MLFVLVISVFSVTAQDYNPNRYRESLFPDVLTIPDVLYGSSPQWIWPYWDEDLYMDVYVPDGDDNPKRPLIIFAHSGGFINGAKDVDDMVAICDSFARKGYVTASIAYRKGFDPLDAESAERAAYRGLQDGKAAVRYFKENASLYDIDTNYIFFGGMSAGGFISLGVGYMDKEAERPASTYGAGLVNELEFLDCAGNDYPHSSEVRAILDFWGGVNDTLLIEPGDIPMMIMHGEHDETVPFVFGHPFGLFTLPESYGGQPISERAENIELYYEFFTSEGSNHMLDGSNNGEWDDDSPNSFWSDTLLPESERFLWENMKPNTARVSDEFLTICNGTSFVLEVTDEPTSHYVWTYDEGEIDLVVDDFSGQIELIFSNEGTFEISVIEFNEILCPGEAISFFVEVTPELEANFTESIVDANLVSFTNSSVGGILYEWDFGDGDFSTTFEPEHTYAVDGMYDVTLTVTDEYGCTSTYSMTLTIAGVGVDENELSNLRLYPNPFTDAFTIKCDQNMEFITVIDATGKLIFQIVDLNTTSFTLNAENWSPGIYFVTIQDEFGQVSSNRMVRN